MSAGSPDTPTPFRFRCPKCGYANHYNVSRTGPSYAQSRGDQWHDKVLACLCGKRLYGQQIVDEYDRQKAEHEGCLEEAALEAHRARRRALAAARKAKEREERAARQARIQARKDGTTKRQAERAGAAAPTPAPVVPAKLCAYTECANEHRPRSMYCSRECSNKNARDRYKARRENTA